jgi:hypothetical protein
MVQHFIARSMTWFTSPSNSKKFSMLSSTFEYFPYQAAFEFLKPSLFGSLLDVQEYPSLAAEPLVGVMRNDLGYVI